MHRFPPALGVHVFHTELNHQNYWKRPVQLFNKYGHLTKIAEDCGGGWFLIAYSELSLSKHIYSSNSGLQAEDRNGEAAPAHLRRAEAGCSGSRRGRSHHHGDQPRDHQLLRHRDGGQVLLHSIIRVSNSLILLHHHT